MTTSSVDLICHSSDSYVPRTRINARSADLTVAFAVNYHSAGERLTKQAAGARYLALPLDWPALTAARVLFQTARKRQARSLNIAGNSLHTLRHSGWTQEQVDQHIYTILAICHYHWPFDNIRSGGQTGVDEAGLVAGIALELPVTALFPAGHRQRSAEGFDLTQDPTMLRMQWEQRADVVKKTDITNVTEH